MQGQQEIIQKWVVEGVVTDLYSIIPFAITIYTWLYIVMNIYETFNMDKSMLKKMYREIIDDDPSSAVDDLMKSTDESPKN